MRLLDVEQEDVEHLEQYVRVRKVQIDLVGTERGPDMSRTTTGGNSREQRQAARPRHAGQVGGRIDFDEVTSIRLTALEVGLATRGCGPTNG